MGGGGVNFIFLRLEELRSSPPQEERSDDEEDERIANSGMSKDLKIVN
jgi:hypothetical protein